MDKRDGVPNRQCTEEFKIEAVRLAGSIGVNQAAKRLGMPQSSVGNWVRRRSGTADASTPVAQHGKQSVSELEAENAWLRRELANAKVDLEIVKKRRHISRRSRGEICLDRDASRPVQRQQDVPAIGGIAFRILPVAQANTQ